MQLINMDGKEEKVFFGSKGSACFDIKVSEYVSLPAGKTVLAKTGLFLKPGCPSDEALLILSRSGLALRGVAVLNAPGVVDSDYPGEIGVILHNFSGEDVGFSPGDRVAQGLVITLPECQLTMREAGNALSQRQGGFGSTGS